MPRKYSDDQLQILRDALDNGASYAEAANTAGIPRHSATYHCKAHRDLRQREGNPLPKPRSGPKSRRHKQPRQQRNTDLPMLKTITTTMDMLVAKLPDNTQEVQLLNAICNRLDTICDRLDEMHKQAQVMNMIQALLENGIRLAPSQITNAHTNGTGSPQTAHNASTNGSAMETPLPIENAKKRGQPKSQKDEEDEPFDYASGFEKDTYYDDDEESLVYSYKEDVALSEHAGYTPREIAEEYNLTAQQVRYIRASAEYKAELEQLRG